MSEEFVWREIDFNPIHPNGVCTELWIHGPVYQLVKKGFLLDKELHCYASHLISKAAVWLQFGEHGTLCSKYDDEPTRNNNLKRIFSYFESHKLNPKILTNASTKEDNFSRNVKQFVDFYFRSRHF